MGLYDDDDAQPGFAYAGLSPLVRLLHQVFAKPVARLGDVAPQLLAGPQPERTGTPSIINMAAAPPRMSGATAPNVTGAVCVAPGVSARDNSYFNRYYGPVAAKAAEFGVNPAFVLGNGFESGYADESVPRSTYHRTRDAFGMTGGNTTKMTYAPSPQQNVDQLFENYGAQMRDAGDDADAYINGLRGRDRSGAPVEGWKTYNQAGKNGKGDPGWEDKIRRSIKQMMREVPVYAQHCAPGAKKSGG